VEFSPFKIFKLTLAESKCLLMINHCCSTLCYWTVIACTHAPYVSHQNVLGKCG